MTPRARVLAEGIKNRLIGIQKSEQIYKDLSRLERKIIAMTENQVVGVANSIASAVDIWFEGRLRISRSPSIEEVLERISIELHNFANENK